MENWSEDTWSGESNRRRALSEKYEFSEARNKTHLEVAARKEVGRPAFRCASQKVRLRYFDFALKKYGFSS